MKYALMVLLCAGLPVWCSSVTYSVDCGSGVQNGSIPPGTNLNQKFIYECQANGVVAGIFWGFIGPEVPSVVAAQLTSSINVSSMMTADVMMQLIVSGPTGGYIMFDPHFTIQDPQRQSASSKFGPWSNGDPLSLASALPFTPGVPLNLEWMFSISARNSTQTIANPVVQLWDANGNPTSLSYPYSMTFLAINDSSPSVPEPRTAAAVLGGLVTIGAVRRCKGCGRTHK
jgi:hypothetical protein